MHGTTNQEILQSVLDTLNQVLGRYTSPNYSLVLLQTAVVRIAEEHPIFKHVVISTATYSSVHVGTKVEPKVNDFSGKDCGAAVQAIVTSVSTPLASQQRRFVEEFKGYLGQAKEMKLKTIGVQL